MTIFTTTKGASPRSTVKRIWTFYIHNLDKRPVRTKAVTAATIGAAGDILAQAISHDRDNQDNNQDNKHTAMFHWDRHRTVRMATYGLLLSGPLTHGWYKLLDFRFGSSMTFRTSIKKMIVDQMFAAPVFTGLFFVAQSVMDYWSWPPILRNTVKKAVTAAVSTVTTPEERGTTSWPLCIDSVKSKVKRELWETLKMNWLIWPSLLTAMFLFVRLQHRVAVSALCGVGWGSYLSYVQARGPTQSTNRKLPAHEVEILEVAGRNAAL